MPALAARGAQVTMLQRTPSWIAVVTATGLVLQALGGVTLFVDGREVALSDTVAYQGAMSSGIPDLVTCLGCTNASWALKCELVCAWVCRLLAHLRTTGADTVVPEWDEPELPDGPLLDRRSGYVLRAAGQLPRQGPRPPWRVHQNALLDRRLFGRGRSAFAGLRFSRRRAGAAEAQAGLGAVSPGRAARGRSRARRARLRRPRRPSRRP